MSKDQSGRYSGYGIHGDRRTKRNRTEQAQMAHELICDNCGKRNAKQADGWRLLCLECRQIEENEDDEY